MTNLPVWYAILHKTDEVIAQGQTYRECSDKALETGLWDLKPGSVSPYYITTIKPR